MKNKCFGVTLALSKYASPMEICSQVHLADSAESAVVLAMQSPYVSQLLLTGYAIASKSAVPFDSSVAPINSEHAGMVVRNFDDSLSYLYIDLSQEYLDDFKQDLQALMSKYYPKIPPIYPDFTPTH